MGKFISILKEARIIAVGKTTVIAPSAGSYAITITVPDLRKVEYVLNYKFTTDPICDPGTPVNEKIVGNVVGFTIVGVGAGTTLTAEILAVGV